MAVDARVADPRRGHPVAAFGAAAARLEQRTYGDSRRAGTVHLIAATAPLTLAAVAVERWSRRHAVTHVLATAATTWAVVGAATLAAEGRAMATALDEATDPATAPTGLAAARDRLPHLCGRDPDQLNVPELARATVESLAENTNDAVLSPLWWGALAGVPGLVAHRAVNTLDAMVGHRSRRYARFGTASAVADDAMAFFPARITGLLACLGAPLVGADGRRAGRTMLRDHSAHPSPNGGWCEAAWAGALGVRLGGRNVYASRVEDRPFLGRGRRPGADQVRVASRLVTVVSWAGAVAAAGALIIEAAQQRPGDDQQPLRPVGE
ncbi:Cobalamin biosynthesis protein CobD [Austwickia sp. TVS 96-490-7B]|nr:Cobalamin biosynthesis protein CobD [Austwickia sp. TVS 96-490-7B]